MHYAYRYRLHPTEAQRELLDYYRDTCRQLYNHALNEFEQSLTQQELSTSECAKSETNYPTSKTGGTISPTCIQLSHKLP